MATILDQIRDTVVTITALGVWVVGLYKYKKSRESESVIQIDLGLETRQTGSSTLVQVKIQIRNVGKAAAHVDLTDQSKVPLCHVRKVTAPPGNSEIPWDGAFTQDLIPAISYMADWFDYAPGEPMIFEPNSAETYHALFSTEYHGLIWVRAVLIDSQEYQYRGDYVFTVP